LQHSVPQVKRAVRFMKDVFDTVEGRVALIVAHSGTIRSLLLAVGREPYHPEVRVAEREAEWPSEPEGGPESQRVTERDKRVTGGLLGLVGV
jgi:hypothetical protein